MTHTNRKHTGTGRPRSGRPRTANRVVVVPVRHERPDAHKLGRALLSLALHQAHLEQLAQHDDEQGGHR